MPLEGTPCIASPYKTVYIWLKHFFVNFSHMNYRTDLILDEAFGMFIFFYFPDSGLSVLTGLHFYFDGVIVKHLLHIICVIYNAVW